MGLFDDGLGGFVSGVFGSKNKFKAQTPQVDPNAYQYGGNAGGANEAANRYRGQAEGAQDRQATQAQNVGVNYGQANQDRNLSMQARQGQSALASAMYGRATGATPSIAQMQADRQMGQAQAAQASMAAGARGAGALALAQQNAAGNTASAQSAISNQAQINGANERMQAEQAASGAYGALRGGDQQSQGQDASQAQFNTTSQVNQNQFNAQQQAQQRAQNDQYSLGMTSNEMGVRNAQMTGQMNQQAQQSANSLSAQGLNAGVSGQNSNMNQMNGGAVLGAGQGLASALISSGGPPAKARGGPVGTGKPYLVGEKGPELIIPNRDGYVLTHEQTKEALADAPAKMISDLWGRNDGGSARQSLASVLGKLPGREEGGDMQAGGAPSTWGTGEGISPEWVASQQAIADEKSHDAQAADDRDTLAAREHEARMASMGKRLNQTIGEIDQKDDAAAWNGAYKERHGQSMTPDEQDAYIEAKYRKNMQNKETQAATTRSRLAMALGKMGDGARNAPTIDTSLHLPQASSAPHLASLPGRAFGGPISAGGAPNGGHGVGGGIELGGSGGITHSDLMAAGTGLSGPMPVPGMVGGGGITGGHVNTGIDGTASGGMSSSSGLGRILGALARREDGGAVAAGGVPQQSAAAQAAGSYATSAPPPSDATDPEEARLKSKVKNDDDAIGQYLRIDPTPEALIPTLHPYESAWRLAATGLTEAAREYDAETLKRYQQEHAKEQRSVAKPEPKHEATTLRTPMLDRTGPKEVAAKDLSASPYETTLTPKEEARFQAWKKQYAPNDSGYDYDYRGAFKQGEGPDKTGHWTDRFKKPNHPTFSRESQYATGQDADRAGYWRDGVFVPPVRSDAKTPTVGEATAGQGASGVAASSVPSRNFLKQILGLK